MDMRLERLSPGHERWADLGVLFSRMYGGMAEQGLPARLVPGGEALWLKNVAFTIGKFAVMVGAVHENSLVGFGHGVIKPTHDYLGGERVGFVSHLYVGADFRRGGTGRRIYGEMEAWFAERAVATVELQVLVQNEEGIAFWSSVGYRTDLLQMRKACALHSAKVGDP